MKKVYSYTDTRETNMQTNDEYIIDANKLQYKVDQEGKFEATYTLKHETQSAEKMVFYILTEDSNEAISIKINGKVKKYHVVEVPKKGEISLNFSISNLPKGEHTIYLFTERYIDSKFKNKHAVEKRSIQSFISPYYFSLQVGDKKNDIISTSKDVIKPLNITKAKNNQGFPLKLFKDINLSEEILENINGDKYYLSFNNSNGFEIKGKILMISDYEIINESQKISSLEVPAYSKVIIPIELTKKDLKSNLRFIYLGSPEISEIEAEFPIKAVYSTFRFLVFK